MVFVLSSNYCAKSLSMNFLCKDMRSTIILSPDIKLSFMTPNKYVGRSSLKIQIDDKQKQWMVKNLGAEK